MNQLRQLMLEELRRRNFADTTIKILSGLLDLSLLVDLRRLPELICGFPRRPGKGPTHIPSSVRPRPGVPEQCS